MTKLVPANRESIRRTVFGTHEQTAHVWAQNRYTRGRSSDERMFWEGPTLFSYGHHFALGHILETTEGRVTLLNSDSYSVSTGKHKRHAWHAANGRILYLPKLTDYARHLRGLTYVGESDYARENRKTAVANLAREIGRDILTMPEDTARFLLDICGRGRSFDKLKRDAEKARDKAAREQKAREIAERKGDAEAMAALSPAEFESWISRRVESPAWGKFPTGERWPGTEYRRARPSETLATIGTELHRLNVSAKAHCGKRVQATLKARLAEIRARAKKTAAMEQKGELLAVFNLHRLELQTYLAAGPIAAAAKNTAARISAGAAWLANVAEIRRRPALVAKLQDIRAAADLRLAVIADEENRERMEREKAARELWLSGSNDSSLRYARFSDENGRALLRAVNVERADYGGAIVGGTLETSHGASVPLVDAIKAFRFVKLVRERGTPWKRNGATLPVGHFQIDAIEPSGAFVAGCHKIGWNEVERLARELGVFDLPPADTTSHGERAA
jgi:hypothetical protein